MRNIGLCCPHCNAQTRAYKSRPLSSLLKEITYLCTNTECGYIFIANLEAVRTISLPSVAKDDIFVPLSQHVSCAVKSRHQSNLMTGVGQ